MRHPQNALHLRQVPPPDRGAGVERRWWHHRGPSLHRRQMLFAHAALLKGEHKHKLEFAGTRKSGGGTALPSPNPSSVSQTTIGNSGEGDSGWERDGWLALAAAVEDTHGADDEAGGKTHLPPTYALHFVRRHVGQHEQVVQWVFNPICVPKRFVHLLGPPQTVVLDARGVGRRGSWSQSLSGRSKDVPDSIVFSHCFGATDMLRLRRPYTATDTPSISRNIKYTQTPAETENIGSPEMASGIGHTSDQFSPTYSLRISLAPSILWCTM
ncbi:hypothetical protein B0H14DRAFT_2611442 [Mycena olivaceomarginata]|nr:hypothetical protein B0H14DRAFT_2611442 [Mycena olivaceomarginata]